MIKDSGNRTPMGDTGFVRDCHDGKGRYDLLPWHAIGDVAKHCEEGAKKYGERNIDKGAPQHSLIDSGIRHLTKYIHGDTDEPHLRAAAWNILWALEQETTHPELNDLPKREKVYPECRHDGIDLACDTCTHQPDDPCDAASPCYICRHNTTDESMNHPCMFDENSGGCDHNEWIGGLHMCDACKNGGLNEDGAPIRTDTCFKCKHFRDDASLPCWFEQHLFEGAKS